jgi:hypothetical protein
MADIVKWKPAEKRSVGALDVLWRDHIVPTVSREPVTPMTPPSRRNDLAAGIPDEVVDLIRCCAVHGKVYMSRYIMRLNWQYAQSIRLTKALYRSQYRDGNRVVVPCSALDEETCPWCGATGLGAICCGACQEAGRVYEICYGKTVDQEGSCYCGWGGKLRSMARNHQGVNL